MIIDQYKSIIYSKLDQICQSQKETIDTVSSLIMESIRSKGLIHLFGSGHSHMLAEECFFRAGGFAPVDAILYEPLMLHESAAKSSEIECYSDMAEKVFMGYPLHPGDILFIFSNSGINSVPIDCALHAKARGLTVVTITSLAHSTVVPSRHPSGKKLYEVADYVLDNCCDMGDTAIDLGDGIRVAPTSTICGTFIMQSIFAEVAVKMLAAGITPPVYASANTVDGKERNSHLIESYAGLVRHL